MTSKICRKNVEGQCPNLAKINSRMRGLKWHGRPRAQGCDYNRDSMGKRLTISKYTTEVEGKAVKMQSRQLVTGPCDKKPLTLTPDKIR